MKWSLKIRSRSATLGCEIKISQQAIIYVVKLYDRNVVHVTYTFMIHAIYVGFPRQRVVLNY